MSAARIPVSGVVSVGVHLAGLAFFLPTLQPAKREMDRVISGVDLLVVRRPMAVLPARPAVPAAPPTVLNFLKMALPSLTRTAPQAVEVKIPETPRVVKPIEAEKLDDLGRKKEAAKVEELDLGRKRVDAAKVDTSFETRRRAVSTLAAAPRLEEVGTRRVQDLPQALALEESRREAVAMQKLDPIVPQFRRKPMAPALAQAVLREATPAERARLGDRVEAFLPAPAAPEVRPAPELQPLKPQIRVEEARRPRPAETLAEAPKKSLEIEGPLADRKILYFEAPPFPAWLRDQGVMEAAVSIRFNVSPAGDVLPGMQVERTSGYGRLDRLAMDALKSWRFVPIGVQEKQWGIITFRFLVE